MRPILAGAGRAIGLSADRPTAPDCADSVTFKARPDVKPVPTFAGSAFAGLRLYCKGANRTPPTRCPAFSRAAATGPPPPPRDFGPGLQPRAGEISQPEERA